MEGIIASNFSTLNYLHFTNDTINLLKEALNTFCYCVCFPQNIESNVNIVKLAMSMSLLVISGICGDCLEEVGFQPRLGVLGRRLLLLSNASSFDIFKPEFSSLLNGYSDIIFLNQTTLMRMGPQITIGRKFLPFQDASQFYRYDKLPNFGGVTLKGAYVNCSPLVLIKENKVTGLEIFLINELGKAMNFTWNITKFKGDPWGKYNNNTWEGGMIGSIMQQHCDIGLCGFWIRLKQLKFVDATLDYSQMIIVYVIPRRFYGKRWKSIYTPFSNELWILIAITVFLSILALHVLSKLIGKGRKFDDWILLVIGRFLGCSPLPSKGPAMFRVAILYVSIAALIVSSMYSSAIVSHLTRPPRLFQPKTVEDLYKMKYFWTTASPIQDPNNIIRLSNKWQKMFNTRFRNSVNLKLVFNRNNYAVLCRLIEKFPLSMNEDGAFLEHMHTYILPELVNIYHIGFPLAKGSPLVNHASRVIDRLKSSGIIDKAINDISRLHGGVDIILVSEKPRPLAIASLQGAFIILLCGKILAFIAFIIELLHAKFVEKRELHNNHCKPF